MEDKIVVRKGICTGMILSQHGVLLAEKNELKSAIEKLKPQIKNVDKEMDAIKKDSRTSVKILYEEYKKACIAYENFMHKFWVEE